MPTQLRSSPAGRNQRPRIAVDMDEVIADSLSQHLAAYNRAFGTQLRAADLHGRHLEDAVPAAEVEAVRALEREPGFFASLAVIAGSQEVLAALTESYELFIATAAMEVPTSFAEKFAWLRRHFPFIPPSHFVFCGDKGVLDVDYLIDDQPRHFEQLRGQGVLFSAPHNRGLQGHLRVHAWDDVRRLFLAPAASSATG
jgi:5'(3')-deoxyribonucleotidase